MAWNGPYTAVANTSFAASDFNTFVRDNLQETAPAKATGSFGNGSIPVKSATNQITFRTPTQTQVTTSQSTTSTSYTNLATSGPTVSVAHGAMAFVSWHASIKNNSDNSSFVSILLSGANSLASNDDRALRHRDGTASGGEEMMGMSFLFTGLNPGTTNFQMQYRVIGGTGTFQNRRVTVIPL